MPNPQSFRDAADAAAGTFEDREPVTLIENGLRAWFYFDAQSTAAAGDDVIVVNSGGRLHRSKDPAVVQASRAFNSVHTAKADDGNTYTKGVRLSDGVVGFLLAGETNLANMATSKPLGWPKADSGTINRAIERWYFTSEQRGTDYGAGDVLKELSVIANGAIQTFWLNFTEGGAPSVLPTPPTAGDYHELFDGTWTDGDGGELNIPVANDRKSIVLTHSAADAALDVQVTLLDQQGATLGQLNTLSLAIGETVSQRIYSAGSTSLVRVAYSGTGASGTTAYKQSVLGFGELPLDSKTVTVATTADTVEEVLAADPAGRQVILFNNHATEPLRFLFNGDAATTSPAIAAGSYYKSPGLVTGNLTVLSTLANHPFIAEVLQ